MRPPTGTCVSVWPGRRWTRMFRLASCFATGPEILLWWKGNLTLTPTTRPTLLVGAPTARLRWTPLVRFEAPLGLFHPWDVSLFSSRALHGAALFLSWDCASVLCSVSVCFREVFFLLQGCALCFFWVFFLPHYPSLWPLPLLFF